jgi:hypothetical protein
MLERSVSSIFTSRVGDVVRIYFVWREAACSTADTLAAGESQVAWSMAESLGAGGNFLLCLRARFGSLAYLISSVFILSYSQI